MSQELEQGLGELMVEAQKIHFDLSESLTNWNDDKIRKWVAKAMNLASSVRADSVSITAGFPAGLSVTVTISSPGERSEER